ncbi:related to transposase [Fusarium oxysporum]|uniref:Related to transposase n=1 Tax=Fusarium oxysporum TaxID=5507 RepID=A0A2H3STF4_FUSOX|nr:related to transposase [Fusarium oxysporum]
MSQSNKESPNILALQAYQEDPKLSLRRATFIYDIHFETLYGRSIGPPARCDWVPKQRKLSDLDEQIIIQYILDLDSRGFPSRHRDVDEMVNQLLADRDASPVGKRWAINFIKRQPELKTCFQKRYDYQTVIRNWFRLVQNTVAKNLPTDWVIATTQNGWTDNKTGLEWLKHFNQCTTSRSTGPYRLLILDGHESHLSADFEIYCEENKIITLYMPPHSSHLLQHLDVGCFGPLKKAYGREIEHLIRRSITHISKIEFFPAVYAAFQATMTEKNIKGGFKGARLVPFDLKSVISKLDVQLRTPTPAEEEAHEAQSWTSSTPRTVLEAGSQSEYLQRRIRRYQSSSPELILEALRLLEKGTKAVMHKVALLVAANRELRQANEILSRRRRAKGPAYRIGEI